jgi:catalase
VPRVTTAKEMIDGVRAAFGHTPGTRTLHSKGAYYSGTFRATPEAGELTKAAHMGGQDVPVTVRLSNGGGDVTVPDYVDDVRGLATSFHLPDGSRTDILAQTSPRSPVGTPEAFLELARAGQPGLKRAVLMPIFLAKHPNALPALAAGLPAVKPPPSYAVRRYYPFHAFKWVAADGSERWIRYTWIPEASEPEISRSEAKRRGPDYLQQEIVARLNGGPVRFTLELTFAAEGDNPHDSMDQWPGDRGRLNAGTLEIAALLPEGPPGGEPFVFDPMRLTDGIEPSDDPILLYRPAAYSESVERRAAEAARASS